MSELRFDELRGEQVVYAIHRQDRTFLPQRESCPLCPTRPGRPPTEIPFPGFEIAVFENRFPAFEAPAGAAEVVVYTDDHDASFGSLPPKRAEDLMWVWRHRYLELGAQDDVAYVFIFENRGVEVGVTLHHPHGQIYAFPFLPPVPALEIAADERLGGCALCALMSDELRDRRRIVDQNDAVLSYVPYAARWPYEVHVALREHRPSLLECEPAELRLLAASLQRLARGYDALFARPFPYMMVVHQAPTDGAARGHLHVELYTPLRTASKLKHLAGSEQGAGTFISDTLPEESAAALREAIASAAERCVAFAPGRVNLIGEHTDYNQGLALPFAIREGVTVQAQATPDSPARIRALASNLGESDEFPIGEPPRAEGWRAFVRGVVAELTQAGLALPGARLAISGQVPRGAGLSSSAAMEVALCLALVGLCTQEPDAVWGPLDRTEIARLCARVENDWVGAQTGLLDQLACLHGAPDTALLIDFRSLSVQPVPLVLGDWRLVVLDSGERHRHASSGYNERRRECERACELLGVRSLREAEPTDAATLPEPLRRRATHVLSENRRVRAAASALSAGDMPALGRLLNASHESLRDCYEVSTPAVEETVKQLLVAGAAGARLIGGGFGGSVLGLLAPGTESPAEAREVRPGAGAHLLAS